MMQSMVIQMNDRQLQTLAQLQAKYAALDPRGNERIDRQNRRRLVRAIEVSVLGCAVNGIGEIGIVGVNAAVANAVFNATGKRIRALPIRPEKLLKA